MELAFVEPGDQPGDQPGLEPEPSDGAASFVIGGAITLGLGGAGLVAGAVTGALTMSQAGDIKSRCTDNRCLPEDEDDAEAAKTLGHISTAAFVIGGAAVAAGVVLLVLSPGGGSADGAAGAFPSVGARLGPAGVKLFATF